MQPLLTKNVLWCFMYICYVFCLEKVSSVLLDIKTMVAMLKYMKDLSITDGLPEDESNVDICADLSRIWWYRREVINYNTLTMDQFEDRWNNISKVRFYLRKRKIVNGFLFSKKYDSMYIVLYS